MVSARLIHYRQTQCPGQIVHVQYFSEVRSSVSVDVPNRQTDRHIPDRQTNSKHNIPIAMRKTITMVKI